MGSKIGAMQGGRVMALDVGKARIGVAVTDPLGYTAQPLLTIWRRTPGEDLRSLARLMRRHQVVAVVVGNPLYLSGEVSPWAAKVHALAETLRVRTGLPVHLWDERLTTVAAHEVLDEAGHDRRDRNAIIDQVAAVVILRSWMEAREQAEARAALGQAAVAQGTPVAGAAGRQTVRRDEEEA
jgi:putative Holliday junction resolvase